MWGVIDLSVHMSGNGYSYFPSFLPFSRLSLPPFVICGYQVSHYVSS